MEDKASPPKRSDSRSRLNGGEGREESRERRPARPANTDSRGGQGQRPPRNPKASSGSEPEPKDEARSPRTAQVVGDVRKLVDRTLQTQSSQISQDSSRLEELLLAMAHQQRLVTEQLNSLQDSVTTRQQEFADNMEAKMSQGNMKILHQLNRLVEANPQISNEHHHAEGHEEHQEGQEDGEGAGRESAEKTGEEETEEEPQEVAKALSLHEKLSVVLHHHRFEVFSGCVIMLNAVHIGVSSDMALQWSVDHPGEGAFVAPFFLEITDYMFFCWYFFELCLKFAVYKCKFWTNHDQAWNIFDFILITQGIWDIVAANLIPAGAVGSFTWLRLLRLMKMLKMLRLVRVARSCKTMRQLMTAVTSSLMTLLWCIVMLLTVIFVFGLCIMQGLVDLLGTTSAAEIGAVNLQALRNDWSSLLGVVYSLLTSVTGGNAWGPLSEPLMLAGPHYYCVFLIYILFAFFAILNIITGIFVDAAIKVATADYEGVIQEMLVREKARVARLREILTESDLDGDGTLTETELQAKLEDAEVKGFFQAFEIPPPDAVKLFKMLESGPKKEVAVDEFLDGCMQLKGAAKSIDMICVLSEARKLGKKLDKSGENAEEEFEAIRGIFKKMGFSAPPKSH